MVRVVVGDYELCCHEGELPPWLSDDRIECALRDYFDVADDVGLPASIVCAGLIWQSPSVLVVQRYTPAEMSFPCVLLIPETHLLFIGCTRRLLGYDLSRPVRLWEEACSGFSSWSLHQAFVLMQSERELAAWDMSGHKLWTRSLEPPWGIRVADGVVSVEDEWGRVTPFLLRNGQPA